MANKYLPPTGSSISASCMNVVRKCKLDQTTVTPTSVNSIETSTNFYKNQASMPNSTGAATNQKFSNFYDASVVTGHIYARAESWSTYGDNNDGLIAINIDCNSIVTKNNQKVYNFKFETGQWIERIETVSSPDANCRVATSTGYSNGNKVVYIRDGLNSAAGQSIVSATVCVGYNDEDRNYCIQRNITNRV